MLAFSTHIPSLKAQNALILNSKLISRIVSVWEEGHGNKLLPYSWWIEGIIKYSRPNPQPRKFTMIYFTWKSGSQHRIGVVDIINHSQPRQKSCILCLLPHGFFEFSLIWTSIPREMEMTISWKKANINFNRETAWFLKAGQSWDDSGYLTDVQMLTFPDESIANSMW